MAGCIIHESDRLSIETNLRVIKQKYFQDQDIEIKSNFLRYANPDIQISSPLKLHDRSQYNQLESDITTFLQTIPIQLIAVTVDKASYWQYYPSQKPYDIAYLDLLQRFQHYLQEKNALGICIIDPREGQVDKAFIGDSLEHIHHAMRWNNGPIGQNCPNIIERLLYATSERTIGIQIADLYCYPIFHIFEYNKSWQDYWRFSDITLPNLLKVNGSADGYGLKFFPENTKKDLACFEIPF